MTRRKLILDVGKTFRVGEVSRSLKDSRKFKETKQVKIGISTVASIWTLEVRNLKMFSTVTCLTLKLLRIYFRKSQPLLGFPCNPFLSTCCKYIFSIHILPPPQLTLHIPSFVILIYVIDTCRQRLFQVPTFFINRTTSVKFHPIFYRV